MIKTGFLLDIVLYLVTAYGVGKNHILLVSFFLGIQIGALISFLVLFLMFGTFYPLNVATLTAGAILSYIFLCDLQVIAKEKKNAALVVV